MRRPGLIKGFRGYELSSIRNVLQHLWKLQPTENSYSYLQYKWGSDGKLYKLHSKGRYYQLSNIEVHQLNNLDDFNEKEITTSK